MKTSLQRACRWRRALLAALGLLALLATPVWAESTEAEVKAAFIYNFAKYVDWPAESLDATPGALTLCLVGARDALFDALTEMDGKTVKNRSLQVRAAARNANLKGCQVLVMAESEADYFEAVVKRLEGVPVLTVNGSGRFLDVGGIIGLVAEGNKVRFDINLGAARRNNLVLSSNLLKLARQVRQQ
jgi:hypothetical protein